jgi:phenylacetate-CoA ligase
MSTPKFVQRVYWTAFLANRVRGQAQYPFTPLAGIMHDRDRAVRRMVSHAFHRVPWYRRALLADGLRPAHIQSADDLARLPLIDADSLRSAPDQFLSTTVNPHTSLTLKTSGSSGTSRAILLDRTSVFLNAAHGERERHMMTEAIGKRYGYREAVIVLSPDREESSTPRVQRFLREHAFFPPGIAIERLYIDATEAPERYLSRLNDFAPDMIQGYGSSIEALCDHVNKAGVEFHHPRAMYFHSDGISERTRTILRARSIPVFSTYESCEALKIGFECQAHWGYHVNIDCYPIRIVDRDGRDVADDTEGEVVVSNLANRALVLLNYRLGDRAVWLQDPCPCGRTLPRLLLKTASPTVSIRLPSGRTVNPSEIYQLFLGDPALQEHQMVQTAAAHFRLNLVVSNDRDRESVARRVAAKFRTVFGDDATAEIVVLDGIPLTTGGKKQKFVSLPGGATECGGVGAA